MKKNLSFLCTMLLCAFVNVAFGQQGPSQIITGNLVRVTPKLSEIRTSQATDIKDTKKLRPGIDDNPQDLRDRVNKRIRFNVDNPKANSIDKNIQSSAFSPNSVNALIQSFDGATQADNITKGFSVTPPDPVVTVGPNHVVQMINLVHKVYDKSGNLLTGPLLFSEIAATATDDGDPISLYDQKADRYVLLQFSQIGSGGSESLIFCVSQTNDPSGAYNVYEFVTTGVMPDYPHVAIWNDSYIVTTHNFNTALTAYLGQGFWAFDRNKMVAGLPTATAIAFQTGPSEGGYLPASFEGMKSPDPTSLPTFLTYVSDETGGAIDELQIRTLTPNFVTPASSTLNVVPSLPTGAFDGRSPSSRSAIEQQGTAVGLDAIADRMMSRIVYRRFDDYESMVMNYAVNVSGVNPTNAGTFQAATRWYELTRPTPASPWVINQQSTYSPGAISGATGVNRWMGCAGIDQRGNIALGYSRSSSTNNPDIYYAERKKSDALNSLGAEQVFHASGGVQTSTGNRWGDYSAMVTDPSDEETMWFTAEYYPATSTGNFSTRIGSFKVTDPITTPTVHFKVGGTIARQQEVIAPHKDYLIDIVMDNAPSQPVTLTLTQSGTATLGVDYSIIIPSPLTFSAGNLSKQFTLRIFDDSFGEPEEYIDFAYTLNANGGNGIAGLYNQKHRATIVGTICVPIAITYTCSSPTASLSATCATGSVTWYDAAGTTLLFTGSPFNTPALTGPTTYRANCAAGACPAEFTPITIPIFPSIAITAPTVTQPTCSTTGTIIVNVTGTTIQSGILTATDATQTGRLFRTGVPATCAGKTNPGLGANTTGARAFDSYSYTNTTGSPICVTVTLSTPPIPTIPIYLATYLGSFVPTNPSTNFLGDAGSSTAVQTSSQTVPAGGTLVVVVHEVNVGGGIGTNYSVTIVGIPHSPFEYSVNNGTSWQASATFSGLSAGNYNLAYRPTGSTCITTYSGNPVVLISAGGVPPTPPSGTANTAICTNTTASLSASCATGTVTWYDASSVAVGFTGSPFVTPNLVANTTYNVRCEAGACVSTFVSVVVSVGIPNSPTGVAISNTTICAGTSVTLSATCSSGVVNWYTSLTGVSAIGTGSPFTYVPDGNTTYFPTCKLAGCESIRGNGTSEINDMLTVSEPVFNRPNTLTALSGVGTAVHYKSFPVSFSSTGSKTISLIASDGAVTTPTAFDSFLCLYGSGGFNAASPLTNILALNDDFNGASDRKSRIVYNVTIPGNYTIVMTTFNNVPVASGGDNPLPWTYKMVILGGDANVSVTVTPAPMPPTAVSVNNTLVCDGSSVILTASCSVPVRPVYQSAMAQAEKELSANAPQVSSILWYTSLTGGVAIGTGSTFTHTPSGNTTYYAACLDGCESSRVATSPVTVGSGSILPPTAVTVNNTLACGGSSVVLSASCGSAPTMPFGPIVSQTGVNNSASLIPSQTGVNSSNAPQAVGVIWYTQATGGVSIGSGSPFTATPSATTTYYAACADGACESSRVATNEVVFNPTTVTPSGIAVSSTAICAGGSVSLSATCSSGTVEWYNALTGGALLGSGSPFTHSPTSTITYFAYCNTVCAGSRVASPQVMVTTPPNVIANFTICPGETASLTASCTSGTLEWYGAATGGSVLSTASPFVTPPITTTTSYFAACKNPDIGGGTTSEVFNFTGAIQTFTVPAGVTSITIEALGAGGGSGAAGGNTAAGGAGGKGSRATGTLAVTPGQVLNIFVGGQGATPTAGFNGGGNGGSTNSGGGGGASDVRFPGNGDADRILVAGGGGGGGRAGCESNTVTGGNGGNGDGNGFNGTNAPTSGGVAGGGAGAIGFNAGSPGVGCSSFLGLTGSPGLATGLGGAGGAGQSCCCFGAPSIPGGGGGGGGYTGGGGGGGGSAGTTGCSGNDKGTGGGGAGGTSFTGGVTAGVVTTNIQTGNGQITISYSSGPATIGCSSNRVEVIVSTDTSPIGTNNPTICSGATASLSATCPVGSLAWFDALTGGSMLSTANPFVTPPLINATTYFAACQIFGNAAPTSDVFIYTGAMQTFTVPAGVTSITIEALGAGGGSGALGGNSATGGAGGKGSRATGTLAVTPGQILNIFVGGTGATPAAGFNGGGAGGNTDSGGGGGASDVRFPGSANTDRILVAGGGGGGGRAGCESNTVTGGNGGNGDGNGFNGTNAPTPGGVAGGGAGAIGFNAGPAGIGCGGFLGAPGGTGLATGLGGSGGAGQTCCCFTFGSIPGGGGGGGGYTGGGGGGGGSAGTAGCSGNDKGAGGGGAGGTSFTGGVTAGVVTTNIQTGNGQITISYTVGSAIACESIRVPANVTISNPAAPTVGATTPLVVCSPSTINLTASGCAGTVTWSNATTGTSLTLSAVGTYSITATCTVNGCTSLTSSTPVLLQINATPIVSANANQTICAGATTSLSATCNLLSVTTTLNGASEVPANASSATGNVIGTFNTTTNQLDLMVAFNGLAANATASHIHKAAVGVNGGVVIGFSGVPAATSGSFAYSGTLTAGQATDLLAGLYYVNIHNSTFPGGEIRGQLSTTCVANSYVWNPGALSGATVMVSPSTTTVYTVTASNSTSGCSATATTSVTIVPLPTASNTGPYLFGQTISLSASSGSAYSWSGPNSFSSTIVNPSIPNAQLSLAGIYTVTVSNVGCTATATTNVVVSGIDPCVQILSYTYVQGGNPSQALFPMTNGMNIAQRPTGTSVIVKPICNTIPVESVDMTITGPGLNWTILQNVEPYALFDNFGTNIYGQVLAPGTYSMTVTGYAQDNRAGGTTYGPVVTSFTIVATPPTISVPTLTGTAFCAGANVNVSFTTTGTFGGGNQFNILLSDASGSFVNAQIIGTAAAAGNVLCTIPIMAIGGENYRIKVVSTDPAAAGNINGAALTVHPVVLNLVSPTNDYPVGTANKQAIETINARNNITGASIIQYKAGNAINLTPGFRVVSHPGSSFKAEIGGCSN